MATPDGFVSQCWKEEEEEENFAINVRWSQSPYTEPEFVCTLPSGGWQKNTERIWLLSSGFEEKHSTWVILRSLCGVLEYLASLSLLASVIRSSDVANQSLR